MTDIRIPYIFEGTVIKRGDVKYESECYQYASSSYMEEDLIRPMVIIKAKNDNDVVKAIKYANENKIAVAIRTGGHQYSGASSTNGKNIQLDLSQTYKDFLWENEDRTLVTLGISFALGEFNAKLRESNRFVPHGQCQYVNVGGHLQTGGYGQLGRSFGLFSDHVEKFRIITADGQTRWVDRKEEDLFFAVLGGSPGNFGVITHVTLKVHKDEDHPNSRGLRAMCRYTPERLKKLLDIMVLDMAGNDDFPADYDYCITVLDDPPSPMIAAELSYDQRFNHKDVRQKVIWTRMIIIFVQWANLQGSQQVYNSDFVDKILDAADINILNYKFLVSVSDKLHTPISKLTSHWIMPIEREYNLPYFKHTYSTNSSSQRLEKFEWTKWVCDRMDDGYKRNLNLAAQLQHFGGSKSQFFQNGKNSPTSFSWRDTNIVAVMDAFYHNHLYEEAKMWVQINDEQVGNPEAIFCEHDRRLLWGSHDLDLSAAHQYYYDQNPEGKYERLCEIKKKYDPSGVFTPNRFCIGLSVPEEHVPADSRDKIQPKIIGSETAKTAKEVIPSVEPQQRAREVDSIELHRSADEKFLEMMTMKKDDDAPIPLWNTWRV